MEINKYQEEAMKNKVYGYGDRVNYPILGLCGEAGEVANKYKKILRDGNGVMTDENHKDLVSEAGDCLWYLAALAEDLGVTLQYLAETNLEKIARRRQNNTINGSGDNR